MTDIAGIDQQNLEVYVMTKDKSVVKYDAFVVKLLRDSRRVERKLVMTFGGAVGA